LQPRIRYTVIPAYHPPGPLRVQRGSASSSVFFREKRERADSGHGHVGGPEMRAGRCRLCAGGVNLLLAFISTNGRGGSVGRRGKRGLPGLPHDSPSSAQNAVGTPLDPNIRSTCQKQPRSSGAGLWPGVFFVRQGLGLLRCQGILMLSLGKRAFFDPGSARRLCWPAAAKTVRGKSDCEGTCPLPPRSRLGRGSQ